MHGLHNKPVFSLASAKFYLPIIGIASAVLAYLSQPEQENQPLYAAGIAAGAAASIFLALYVFLKAPIVEAEPAQPEPREHTESQQHELLVISRNVLMLHAELLQLPASEIIEKLPEIESTVNSTINRLNSTFPTERPPAFSRTMNELQGVLEAVNTLRRTLDRSQERSTPWQTVSFNAPSTPSTADPVNNCH